MALSQEEIKKFNLTTPEGIAFVEKLREMNANPKFNQIVKEDTEKIEENRIQFEKEQAELNKTEDIAMDLKKEKYKMALESSLEECPENAVGSPHEIIYKIDDLIIYGGYCDGIRGTDHNFLLEDDMSWQEVLEMGTLCVPETSSYISNETLPEFEEIGWSQLPLDNNHIVNFKGTPSVSANTLDEQLDGLLHSLNEPEVMFKEHEYEM